MADPIFSQNYCRSLEFNSASGTGILVLADFSHLKLEPHRRELERSHWVGARVRIEDISLMSWVLRMQDRPTPLPPIKARDNFQQKALKLRAIRDLFPEIKLNFYISINNGPWRFKNQISLQNFGEPYFPSVLNPGFTQGEVLDTSEDTRIGCQIQDAGHGLLTGNDLITLECHYTEYLSLQPKPAIAAVKSVSIFSKDIPVWRPGESFTPVMIRGFAPNRIGLILENAGDAEIWISIGNPPRLGEDGSIEGLGLFHRGSTLNLGQNQQIARPEAVWAIATPPQDNPNFVSNSVRLQGMEELL
ncbi:hypothetical protein [Laspinema palackyanum]|uniref:hypothetical protein n=1 Tax=Laspinema palackyanum TaxID=3231601 RepID=UPI00345DD01C|nr:hypothetical protein [Laspinema sp. D2c]